MRVIIFLLSVLVFTTAYSQQKEDQISISFENASYQEVFQMLTSQTEFRFSYNPDIVPDSRITQDFVEVSVAEILNELLTDELDYAFVGDFIVIRQQPKKETNTKSEIAKTTFTGTIRDAKTGTQLSNVSVYETENLTASLSDKQGSYQLSVAGQQQLILAISKKNYRDTVFVIDSKTDLSALDQIYLIPEDQHDTSIVELRFLSFVTNKKAREHIKNIRLLRERWAQVSLFPGLGTNGFFGGKVANKYSLNVIAGYNYSVSRLEIGGALNMQRENMRGVQIAGVSNIVGQNVKGVQIAGATNTNFEDTKGVVISGVMNSSASMHGVQISGAYNYVKHQVKGVQASSGFNYAGSLSGLQIGVVNIAKHVDKGVMFGILNLTKGGVLLLEMEHNDVTQYNVSLKSGVPALYSIITSGISPHGNNKLWSYGMGLGSRLMTIKKFKFYLEGVSHTVNPLTSHISGANIDNRLSPVFSYQLADRVSINAGPSIHYLLVGNRQEANVQFFDQIGRNHLVSEGRHKVWIGYQFAISF